MARRVVNIPTPSLGLDTKNDNDTIGDTNTPYCLNTDFDQPGLIIQRAGSQKVGVEISSSNAGKGLFPFIKDASASFLVSKFDRFAVCPQTSSDVHRRQHPPPSDIHVTDLLIIPCRYTYHSSPCFPPFLFLSPKPL